MSSYAGSMHSLCLLEPASHKIVAGCSFHQYGWLGFVGIDLATLAISTRALWRVSRRWTWRRGRSICCCVDTYGRDELYPRKVFQERPWPAFKFGVPS